MPPRRAPSAFSTRATTSVLLAQHAIGDDHRALDAEPLALERQLADGAVAEDDARRLVDAEVEIAAVGHGARYFSSRNEVGTRVAHSTSSLDALTYFTMRRHLAP